MDDSQYEMELFNYLNLSQDKNEQLFVYLGVETWQFRHN